MRVRWLRAALAELDAEAEYIARDYPRAAAKMVGSIATAVARLTRHPAMGRPGRVAGTRELAAQGRSTNLVSGSLSAA